MDRAGQLFDNRYRLERLLGQGGMAAVWLARDTKLDKSVAVKVLSEGCAGSPTAAQRFVQEARAASRVRHPNVVDVTDFGVSEDGAAYMVMELLRGEDLALTLAREGPLPWSRVGPIGLQICAALAAAHRVGVVHSDIKPANCLRVSSAAGMADFIKVVDFGIARVLDPRHRVDEPSTAGVVLGTPEYMAPEVAAGAEARPAADLYAVGALLYKLLTGVPPFVGESPGEVLSKQIFEAPVPPRLRAPERQIPEAAEALILRALAKAPAERHVDMAALAIAIADTLPQRPAVELWFAPSVSGTSLVAPVSTIVVAEAAAWLVPEPPPAAPELPRIEVPRTLTLPVMPVSPRRRAPLVFAGVGLVLLGALAWAVVDHLVLKGVSQDMRQETGVIEHVASGMHESADLETGGSRGARTGAAPDELAMPSPGPADHEPAASARSGQPLAREGAPMPTPMAGEGGAGVRLASAGPDELVAPEAALQPAPMSGEGGEGVRLASAGPDELLAPVDIQPPSQRAAEDDGTVRLAIDAPAPGFDAEAARRLLALAAAEVQRCARANDMQRGAIELRVAIAVDGRVIDVGQALASQPIVPAALACMRRVLTTTRLAPSAGDVEVAYDI